MLVIINQFWIWPTNYSYSRLPCHSIGAIVPKTETNELTNLTWFCLFLMIFQHFKQFSTLENSSIQLIKSLTQFPFLEKNRWLKNNNEVIKNRNCFGAYWANNNSRMFVLLFVSLCVGRIEGSSSSSLWAWLRHCSAAPATAIATFDSDCSSSSSSCKMKIPLFGSEASSKYACN